MSNFYTWWVALKASDGNTPEHTIVCEVKAMTYRYATSVAVKYVTGIMEDDALVEVKWSSSFLDDDAAPSMAPDWVQAAVIDDGLHLIPTEYDSDTPPKGYAKGDEPYKTGSSYTIPNKNKVSQLPPPKPREPSNYSKIELVTKEFLKEIAGGSTFTEVNK